MGNVFVILILGAILVAGCATTQVISVWKDPSYQAHPAKVMIIGVAKNPIYRRLFEDEFVKQIRARGSDAIASYTVLSDQLQEDQGAVAAKVKELGVDTLLITRMVSSKTVQYYVPGTAYYPPPYYGTWPDYYGYGYRYMYSPGYVAEDEYAVIETNLYETVSDKLVWAATSEVSISHPDQKLISSYIDIMVNSMAGNGLLAK